MRRIVGLSASNRVWGNCEAAVKRILVSALDDSDIDADFVRLTDFSIHPCRGCFSCLSENGRCPIQDDLYDLLERLRSADGLVLAAPVYFCCPPATLIALLDRFLTNAAHDWPQADDKPCVTITIMGNRKWRGVVEPLVNMTASLLGFSIRASLSLVAEGPGEVLTDDRVVRRLDEAGKALIENTWAGQPERKGICPTCMSDFFRIEPPLIVCPICGDKAELSSYAETGQFRSVEREPRWGVLWLMRHVESWIKPSVRRYRKKRRELFERLREVKSLYSLIEERGKRDVR